MKKILSILMAFAMLFMVACGGGGNKQPAGDDKKATKADSGEKYKIYLITMDQMDQHWVNVDKGAQKAVAELGNVDYQWLAPDVKDDAKQIECINNAISGGANAILLAANGPDAVTATLKEAEAEGIKIVYVDSPADFPGVQTLATDNEAAGKLAGEEMLKALEANGVKNGKVGIINVNASTDSVVARENGFRAAFDGKGYEVLETQYCEGDAAKSKDMASNFIAQGVVALFGANEGSTVGIGNAIKESGGKVLGIGFDKSDTIMQLIDDGSIIATMAQNPEVMGEEGIKTAVKALKGEDTGADFVDTGVTVLTKEK